MNWIKVSDENGGVYAREAEPDPAEIVVMADLEAQITALDAQIAEIEEQIPATIPIEQLTDIVAALDACGAMKADLERLVAKRDAILGNR